MPLAVKTTIELEERTAAAGAEEKKKEQLEKAMKGDGGEVSTPGEQGDADDQAAADSSEVPVRDMIPYSAFHRDVTDEYFKQLVSHLKHWGYQCLCSTGLRTCATSRHAVRRDSTWGQGEVPTWTEYS